MSAPAAPQQRRKPKPTVTPPRTVDEWVVKNLNNDIVTLVILSWELGVTNASMAVVDRADACGFDMRCLNNRGQAVHHRVTYRNAPCTTVDAVKRELAELRGLVRHGPRRGLPRRAEDARSEVRAVARAHDRLPQDAEGGLRHVVRFVGWSKSITDCSSRSTRVLR